MVATVFKSSITVALTLAGIADFLLAYEGIILNMKFENLQFDSQCGCVGALC